jgi:hypothetical protein
MGQGFTEYLLPKTGRREGVAFSVFIDYRLPDGTKLHVLHQEAWCPCCRMFVAAEDIPSVESMEEEIRRLVAADPDLLQQWAFVSNGAPVAGRIAVLRRRIGWRQQRHSPPHCLGCGSVGVVEIPGSGEFAHPETGELVVVGFTGWVDSEPWCAEFTPEGESIANPDAAAGRPCDGGSPSSAVTSA